MIEEEAAKPLEVSAHRHMAATVGGLSAPCLSREWDPLTTGGLCQPPNGQGADAEACVVMWRGQVSKTYKMQVERQQVDPTTIDMSTPSTAMLAWLST